jgi:2-dehydro-3-deoxy-L-rhamnonate dehydrogenase (NAD+)
MRRPGSILPDAFREVVNVGLIGTFYCCRAVVPHMIATTYGRIVNVSSVAGKESNPKAPAYSSMKAAVLALTCWLATEENSFTTDVVFNLSGGRATYQ